MCGADDPDGLHLYRVKGLPPRVRSRLPGRDHRTAVDGITSACAEQTDSRIAIPGRRRDYLRVCGADWSCRALTWPASGLPPRVRSRPAFVTSAAANGGITSACAEQTHPIMDADDDDPDYLRVCGADAGQFIRQEFAKGLPPRVRSRPCEQPHQRDEGGITSACAEQTHAIVQSQFGWRDYLRVCGADTGGQALGYGGRGLPPRVRSRQRVRPACASRERITSACAEQTGGDQQHQRPRRDYLRVCGADGLDADGFVVHAGLPPRVRSRRCRNNRAWSRRRITSACAEQTRYPCTNPFMVRDYLRVCGADRDGAIDSMSVGGLPPRVRSRPRHQKP